MIIMENLYIAADDNNGEPEQKSPERLMEQLEENDSFKYFVTRLIEIYVDYSKDHYSITLSHAFY
jgi:hypothetical protein